MLELVHRPEGELDVAFGVNVVESFPGDFAHIVDVHVVVHHYNTFREHRARQPPDSVHHFARVARVALPDRHDHQIVEDAFGGHVHVHDFGQLFPHQGEENSLYGVAHPVVFHGRRADDGRDVDGVFAPCEAGNVERRELVLERIITGVVAERPFGADVVEVHVAFQHDFRVGGHLQVYGLAGHEFQRIAAQDAFQGFLYYSPFRYAYSSKLHGFFVYPLGNYHLEDVWLG